jgi:hypothetical protein
MQITNDEQDVLWRLYIAGAQLILRPIASGSLSLRMFNRDVVRTVLSLDTRGLLRIDEAASERAAMPGAPVQYIAIAATLTEAGRDALMSHAGRVRVGRTKDQRASKQ